MEITINTIIGQPTTINVDNLIAQKTIRHGLTGYHAVEGDVLYPIAPLEFLRLKSLLNVIGNHIYCIDSDDKQEYIIPHKLIKKITFVSKNLYAIYTTRDTFVLIKKKGIISKKKLTLEYI